MNVYKEGSQTESFEIPFSIGRFASTTQVLNLQKELSDLSQSIDRLAGYGSSPELDKLVLQQLSKQSTLDYILGKNIDSNINDVRTFLENSNLNPESKRDAEILLGDLMTQKSQGPLPRLNGYTASQDFLEREGVPPFQQSFTRTRYQQIDFETDTSGIVRAYVLNGKRIEMNGKDTEILPEIFDDNKEVLKLLMDNPKLDSLDTKYYLKIVPGKEVLDSPEYEEVKKTAEQARTYYQNALKSAQEQGKGDLVPELEMKIAGTFISERRNDLAIEEYERLSNPEYPPEIASKAKMMLANLKFQEAPVENAAEAKRLLQEAILADPNNLDARLAKSRMDEFYLNRYKGTALAESARSYQEAMSHIGDSGAVWQTTKDIFGVIATPATTAYLAYGKGDAFIQQMNENANLGIARQIAAEQLIMLTQRGIDLKEFSELDGFQKFMALYSVNNYVDAISAEELQKYMRTAGISLQDLNSPEKLEKLKELIIQEKGELAAQRFGEKAIETYRKMVLIDEGLKNDATLFMIASGDGKLKNLEFNGDLSNAYKEDRLGKKIEYSTAENAILGFADVALNPASYLGISAAAKAGNLAKFLVLNTGVAAVLNSGITVASEYNPALASILMVGAISHGFLVGGLEDATQAARRVSILEDGTHYMQVTQEEISKMKTVAKNLKAEIDEVAQTITLSDGKVIKYGVEVADKPAIHTGIEAIEQASTDVEHAEDAISQTISDAKKGKAAGVGERAVKTESLSILDKVKDEELSSSVRQIDLERIELSSQEISRIKSGKFTEEEFKKIEEARLLLNKNELSLDQQIEIILSHNAANQFYGFDDFSRISTKVRLLEHFSLDEKRILMKNWIVGEGNFIDSTKKFASTKGSLISGYNIDEFSEYLKMDAEEVSYNLIGNDFGGPKVEVEKVNDPKYGELIKAFPIDEELKSKGIFYYYRKNINGVYTPVGIGDGTSMFFSIPEIPSLIFRTPEELRGTKFNPTIYVRFEPINEAQWPAAGDVGNLPFLSDRLNPKRGPRISTFTENQLEKDGYFLMTQKEKDEYLKNFGIDREVRNRRMIYFQIEQGTNTELYKGRTNVYTNIIVDGKVVPAVKVLSVQ